MKIFEPAFSRIVAGVIFFGSIFGYSPQNDADELQLSLQNGTVITADVEEITLQWTTVLRNGGLTTRPFRLFDVERIVFSDSSSSQNIAKVRRWISQLGSSEYLERQHAEAKLSEAQIGGKFKSLIKAYKNDESFEIRYRVNRILDRLDNADNELGIEFDRLTLKNASPVDGDAGEFKLNCTYRGRSFSLTRSEIKMIAQPGDGGSHRDLATPVDVSLFHNHEGEFYLPNQTTVDFETAPSGAEITRGTPVDELYVPWGLRLSGENTNHVGVSGYAFKFAPLPPAKNSVCVFQTSGGYTKRFKGILEIQFCMPNQKSIPAGVHEFGVFLARVNHSRDFLVEAYNEHGQLLASVESTDQPCVFSGIKSNEPITRIRILANPYLFRVERSDFDVDYAIDNLCFSSPVAVSSPVGNLLTNIELNNGDSLKCSRFVVTGQDSFSIDVLNESGIELKQNDIRSIRFNNQPVANAKQWMAMLSDGSVLQVKPGDPFVSSSFPKLSFSMDEITGLWWSRSPARYPESTDFDQGPTVMVFPTCRIATDVSFDEQGYSWSDQAAKIEQPLHTDGEEKKEDPTVRISKIQYANASPENIPTLWNSPPKTAPSGAGRIRLTDGQQIVLGGPAGFKIDSFQEDSVTISNSGNPTVIPFSRLRSIQFPSE